MLKENNKVKVRFYDGIKYPHKKTEIKRDYSDKVFTVRKKNGQLGIDFNTDKNPYICNGDRFVPFSCFAPCFEFENIETGVLYHFNTVSGELEAILEEVVDNG
ncbi:MAG: hypothetical protein UGF89_12705 [Acutalibacteraceae bacterium]|nr:hypothetical protein [Acutalibacteraceae bacterium]